MAEQTAIEWCDATWSPWEGCTKVSPGCDNCYAAGMNRWLRKGENWGPGAPRRVYGSDHWDKPVKWQKRLATSGTRMKVFPSVCDPFDNEVAPVIRARFFTLMMLTPNIDWLLLTKRIGNVVKMLPPEGLPPNVWLGITVVNQEEADRDIPKLLDTPARVRFLSMEPLLGPVDLRFHFFSEPTGNWRTKGGKRQMELRKPDDGGIHWVIAGGESGAKARPMSPNWARTLRDQCAAAGVPFLFKQWGAWLPAETDAPGDGECYAVADDGTDREITGRAAWCAVDEQEFLKVGKKAAGRLLDGVEHNGYPEVSHA